MTRDEAMLKLLEVEPERRDRLLQVTGWPLEVTVACLDRLQSAGRIASVATVSCALGHRVYYIPRMHDAAVENLLHERDVRRERKRTEERRRGAAGRKKANARHRK